MFLGLVGGPLFFVSFSCFSFLVCSLLSILPVYLVAACTCTFFGG